MIIYVQIAIMVLVLDLIILDHLVHNHSNAYRYSAVPLEDTDKSSIVAIKNTNQHNLLWRQETKFESMTWQKS
jgi:hypothetical protein